MDRFWFVLFWILYQNEMKKNFLFDFQVFSLLDIFYRKSIFEFLLNIRPPHGKCVSETHVNEDRHEILFQSFVLAILHHLQYHQCIVEHQVECICEFSEYLLILSWHNCEYPRQKINQIFLNFSCHLKIVCFDFICVTRNLIEYFDKDVHVFENSSGAGIRSSSWSGNRGFSDVLFGIFLPGHLFNSKQRSNIVFSLQWKFLFVCEVRELVEFLNVLVDVFVERFILCNWDDHAAKDA